VLSEYNKGNISLNGGNCWDFPVYISDIILPEKDSASDTQIIIGNVGLTYKAKPNDLLEWLDITKLGVVLKISFNKTNDNSLVVEREIYSRVINHMTTQNATPNVVICFTAFTCDNIVENLGSKYIGVNSTDDIKNLKNNLDTLRLQPRTTNVANILMLEKINGPKLYKWIETPHTKEEWLSVLFQVYYTLLIFNFYGLRHNDLHLGNILMEKSLKQTFKYYTTQNLDLYYEIPVKDCVKIYDFDWSASNSSLYAVHNQKLDEYCQPFGVCNNKNPKFDAFVFTYMLYHTAKDMYKDATRKQEAELLGKFCTSIFYNNLTLLGQEFPHYGRICKKDLADITNNIKRCRGDYEPTDQEMMTLPQILSLPIFNTFKKTGASIKDLSNAEKAEKNIFHIPVVG